MISIRYAWTDPCISGRAMAMKKVVSERLLFEWRVGVEGQIICISSRETGEELGSAAITPGDEPTLWTISLWLEDAAEHGAEALAVLTQVGLDVVGAELVEVIALTDDAAGARALERIGYNRVDRARAGHDGPVVDRWIASASTAAEREAPGLYVERAVDAPPAWLPAVWGPSTTEALGHYAD